MLLSLAKPSWNVPFIMPKRIAATPAWEQISEYVGSGPFVFAKDEWAPGNKAVFKRFEDYQPRDEPPSWAAGGKVAEVDRVEGDHNAALRVTAQALAIWEWQPQSQLIFGVVYLDREDISFLPAGGLIWIPNEANRLELIFPRPRFLHRFRQTAIFEDWWSIGAEFGGGEWAIQRAGGTDDVVDITDYRITAGFERKSIDYLVGIRFEVGYVFGREIEYTSGAPGFEPSDTLLVRAGFFY